MPSRLIADLHPQLQPLCQQFLDNCAHAGIKVGLNCTYRSNAEQDVAYAQGRSAPGPVITNAKAGQSAHNFVLSDGTPASCAFDFFIYAPDGKHLDWDAKDATWQKVLKIGEALGLVSGSQWKSIKDNPHMELADWRNAPTTSTI